MAGTPTSGYGSALSWGFSPAVDLYALYRETPATPAPSSSSHVTEAVQTPECFQALVAGGSDGRHVLLTLSRACRHLDENGVTPSMEFHVAEHSYESYARQMLFFCLMHEDHATMSVQDKTEMFLELFGNSLVRGLTSDYLVAAATRLIGVITESPSVKKLEIFPLADLKFKERDILESIFQFWRNTDVKYFNMAQLWEDRLRAHFGVRYDHRANVLDWDLVMRLQPHAKILHNFEYRNWRMTGVAFEPREGTYDVPNRTLASGAIINQQKRRGYWGDIVNGPFIAFGVSTENESLFEMKNEKFVHNASEVFLWNVTSMISEYHSGIPYLTQQKPQPPVAVAQEDVATHGKDDDDGPGVVELPSDDDDDEQQGTSKTQDAHNVADTGPAMKTEEAKGEPLTHLVSGMSLGDKEDANKKRGPISNAKNKIRLLSMDMFPTKMISKSKYRGRFHCMYLSNTMVHHFKQAGMFDLLQAGGIVVVETCKFMTQQKQEEVDAYRKHVVELASSVGLVADRAAQKLLLEPSAHLVFRKPLQNVNTSM